MTSDTPETVAEACERVKITEDELAQILAAVDLERQQGLRVVPVPIPSPTPQQRALTRAWRAAEHLAEAQSLELHTDAGGFPVLVVPQSYHPVRPEESPVPGQTGPEVKKPYLNLTARCAKLDNDLRDLRCALGAAGSFYDLARDLLQIAETNVRFAYRAACAAECVEFHKKRSLND